MAYNFSALKQKVKDTESWLVREFGGVRTGRANPVLLDTVMVDSYGSKMPINQVGNISVEDARTLRISPWDHSLIKEIEKAVNQADIGVSVSVDDMGLRVSFPELTSERRTQLIKVAKEKFEQARIALRTEREAVWSDIQKQEKDGKMSEDDKFRGKEDMQKIIDTGNSALEALFAKKEKEIAN
ncbi:MAG: ribosome recycling factor [bacterium]|nr:ribosome recycling factor [bacterium]